MIDIDIAVELVNRLRAQRGFGFLEPEAVSELIAAVRQARDEQHARDAIEWLMEHSPERPAPFDIRQALEAHPEPARAIADRSCGLCYGTGFEHHWHERLEIWHAKPCTGCEYGKSLATAHAGREAERAEKLAKRRT